MQNTLGDLNNHLFAQLERLNDEEIKGEELKEEIERSKAVSNIAKGIIDNGQLVLQAQKFADDQMNADGKMPKLLNGGV
ncbi:hypothetical protein ISO99_04860 [Staphylococcus sp. 18_1_E_LY]|jgi:hypothetical protein|uniref:Phage protein n=1 Tax=Staphylococcus lloydii TaxID=2781774 RepID=A0A7T1AYW7_9STAP|nr:hypothetical protein [Staphylococcus lloydii]MBF7019237.1 hypothetical protein [Staphylococcus lloydii]MBF7026965.1 hypothetical protein [Staphylococcus lloydii]QPM74613.1 hypothetical protein ISP08_09720 [Staphylococcus lloydii]